jgi:hypothetical protein
MFEAKSHRNFNHIGVRTLILYGTPTKSITQLRYPSPDTALLGVSVYVMSDPRRGGGGFGPRPH